MHIMNAASATYVHIHPLSISSVSIKIGGHDDQLFVGDKVPYAALISCSVLWLHRVEIKFESRGEGEDGQEQAADQS